MTFWLKQCTLFFFTIQLTAQVTTVDTVTKDTSFWNGENSFGLFFNQSAYGDYWKGGGASSIATRTNLILQKNYQKDKTNWANRLILKYGIIKLNGLEFQKNEDHFELDSKYGYRISKRLKFSGLFNFTTRVHDTYQIKKTGERGKLIGNFLAPGYINLGIGFDFFTDKKVLTIYYTPANSKISIVRLDELKSQFLPPDIEGNVRYELGSLLTLEFKKEIFTNVYWHTIGKFFTNHLKGFGKIDIDFENRIRFKINKNLSANLNTHIIYDEDILFDIEPEDGEPYQGPRTQFKEIFNIGFSQTF